VKDSLHPVWKRIRPQTATFCIPHITHRSAVTSTFYHPHSARRNSAFYQQPFLFA